MQSQLEGGGFFKAVVPIIVVGLLTLSLVVTAGDGGVAVVIHVRVVGGLVTTTVVVLVAELMGIAIDVVVVGPLSLLC